MQGPPDRPQDVVASGYDRVADAYAALERPDAEWPRMRRLLDLLELLPDRGCVLDVGCGAGIPATRAIAERHDAVGVDVSAEQIRRARANVPGATFVHGDIDALDFPAGSFAAIVALYALDHVPRSAHAGLFRRFGRWLAPGGWLLFSVEPYDEPGRTDEWLGVPMYFSGSDPDTACRLVEEAGFDVARREVETQLEGGREVDFLWVLARRRG